MRWREQDAATTAREDGRFRAGWVFAAVWLIYLGEPVGALAHRTADWQRTLGWVGLAGFAGCYLAAVAIGRRDRHTRTMRPLPVRWLQVIGLTVLAALVVPGAGEHALAAAPYVAALAVMTLPVRQAWALVAVSTSVIELLLHLVPGWGEGGYGLGVLLAAVAVHGIRLAFERNERLLQTQDELARLAVQSERARIAADLHDILGHSLTVVTVKAELAQRLFDMDPDRARAELADLEKLSRDALADVRSTALGVRGVSLPGEIAAARAALRAAGIEGDLPTAADDVPTRLRELFAWTIREAVTNVVRHSRAQHCEVRLAPDRLEVLDDGVGGASCAAGQGLTGLRRRAEALDASLTVASRSDGPGLVVRLQASPEDVSAVRARPVAAPLAQAEASG